MSAEASESAAFAPRELPGRRDLRWFGLVLLVFFALLGGALGWGGATRAARGLFGIGLALAALYYAIPPLRLPLYLSWMRGVRPLGQTVTRLALGLIFYGLITPLALLMRLFRRDALALRRDPTRDSYWTPHDPSSDVDRYLRQT